MEHDPQPQGFWMQDVLKANCELMRGLILLLIHNGIAAEEEIMLMASFAKKRLEADPDKEMGRRASAYVDLFLQSLATKNPQDNPVQ